MSADRQRRLSEADLLRLAEYSTAFTFEHPKSNGNASARNRPMRKRNRAIKAIKAYNDPTARSVLRYSTEG